MDYKQPTKEQFSDIMDCYWIMLKELESKAWCDNDVILKRWVEGFYGHWNDITDREQHPAWKEVEKTV